VFSTTAVNIVYTVDSISDDGMTFNGISESLYGWSQIIPLVASLAAILVLT